MINGLYKSGRTAFASGDIKWKPKNGDTIKCLLVTRGYEPDLAKDKSLSNIPSRSRLGKAGNTDTGSFPVLSLFTPEDGVCDALDVDFGLVPVNNEIKGVVIYKDAKEDKSTILIAFVAVDFITNGTQVIIGWDKGPGKIFKI